MSYAKDRLLSRMSLQPAWYAGKAQRTAAYGRAPMRPYGAPQNDLPKSIQKLLP